MIISVIIEAVQSFFGLGDSILELALVSLVLTMAAVFSWVVIGFFMSWAERFELYLLRRWFGYSFSKLFHNILTFPGVVMHECAHAAFALLTGSRVTEICVFETGAYIGHISHYTRGPAAWQAVQMVVISCAPTVVGVVLGYFMLISILSGSNPLWLDILFLYFEVCILNHISMSDVDLQYYISNIWVFILPFFLFFMAFCLWHFKWVEKWVEFLF